MPTLTTHNALKSSTLNKKWPSIAILIPHFNNEIGLIKTIQSISYSGRIHLVIVDDGSKNKVQQSTINTIINTTNTKFHIIEHVKNIGVTSALNTGLVFINNKLDIDYIARIDAGDLQLNDRLNKQVKFMENNPNIGITGTSAQFVTNYGKVKFVTKYSSKNKGIRNQMGLRCSLLHPTVMYRKSVLGNTSLYPSNYPHAEDYAFFLELMKKTEVANMDEVLTQVEYNENGVSLTNRIQQLKSRIKIIFHNFFSSPYSIIGILYTAGMIAVPYRLINVLKSKLL